MASRTRIHRKPTALLAAVPSVDVVDPQQAGSSSKPLVSSSRPTANTTTSSSSRWGRCHRRPPSTLTTTSTSITPITKATQTTTTITTTTTTPKTTTNSTTTPTTTQPRHLIPSPRWRPPHPRTMSSPKKPPRATTSHSSRVPSSATGSRATPSPSSTPRPTPSTWKRQSLCPRHTRTTALYKETATAAGEVWTPTDWLLPIPSPAEARTARRSTFADRVTALAPAIGFSYFETLILTATPAKIAAEIARLAELDQYIENVGGFQRFLWEDMAEETMLILADIQANLANPDVAIASLQAKFNDDGVSNAVIYHLRLLAASYLKGNVDNYEPFIGGSAKEYSSGTIEPANREIEHIGIILLVEVLLRPADFVLEIVYLDRTPMSKANTYRFPEEHNARPESELGPTIHLLYRPDHYDILYKPPPTPVDVQVHRAADFTHQFQIAPANIAPCGPLEPEVDFELLLAMNSYSAAAGNPLASMLPFDLGPATTAYSPSPEAQPPQSWGEPPCSEPLPVRHTPAASASPTRSIITPHTQHQPRSQSQSPRMQQQPEHQQQQAPEHVQSVMPVAPSPIVTTHPLRFSRYSFPTKTAEGVSEVKSVDGQAMALAAVTEHHPMATEAFRNSHFNVAHFNNPNFQPEEYRRPHAGERRRSADDDASEGGTTRRKKKEKSIKAEPKEDV
ncbi:hypothetical protein RB601_000481 [Gaeumannomyces tritici]